MAYKAYIFLDQNQGDLPAIAAAVVANDVFEILTKGLPAQENPLAILADGKGETVADALKDAHSQWRLQGGIQVIQNFDIWVRVWFANEDRSGCFDHTEMEERLPANFAEHWGENRRINFSEQVPRVTYCLTD